MIARLGEICEIVSGTTPNSNVPEYWDGEINWVTPAELNNDTVVIFESQRKITEQAIKDSSLKSFPAGTVLLSSRAPIGKVAIAGVEMFCNQGFKNLICSDKIHNKYLFWFLKGKTDYLNSLGRGATFKEISKSIVENIEIPLPSIDEQERYASTLDKLTDLISLRNQQLAKLDELVKARFVEMFGECAKKDLIGNVAAISRGASPRPISEYITDASDGVNWIRIGDVSENSLYIDQTEEKITLEGAKKSRYVHKGDFILSNSMSFGRPYILNVDGCVHDGWLIISDYSETFQPLYLYHAVRDCEVQNQFSGKVNGATVKNLNSDLVKSTWIKIPPLDLQRLFAQFCLDVERSKLTIRQSLDKLEVLRKSLMQEYFG